MPPLTTIETTTEDTPVLNDDNSFLSARCAHSVGSDDESTLETDYYQNPTLLSRLILSQKYGSALRRLYSTPIEARIWLSSKRQDDSFSIRQLPIHMACTCLVRTHDSRALGQLNELIATLVVVYPAGSHQPDHRSSTSRPIQEALWHGADPRTISIFLMAHPESLSLKDAKGRSLSDLNEHRSGVRKEEVQRLLNQSLQFWTTARDEAFVRLRHGTIPHGSVSSSSVLASFCGDESDWDDGAKAVQKQPEPSSTTTAPPPPPPDSTPLSWAQLEKRALAAEQMLAETIEKNYELSRRVLEHGVVPNNSELLREITRIGLENGTLGRKVRELEKIIEDNLLAGNDALAQQQRLVLAEVSSLVGLSEGTSLISGGMASNSPRLTRKIQHMSDRVARQQGEQREYIRKIKYVVESMLGGSTGDATTIVSALTNHSSSYYDTFTYDDIDENGKKKTMIVDRLPRQRDIVDNLELIFRYAAAYDYARRFPSAAAKAPAEEDLSAILDMSQPSSTSGTGKKPVVPRPENVDPSSQREIELPTLLPPDEVGYSEASQVEGVSGGVDVMNIDQRSI